MLWPRSSSQSSASRHCSDEEPSPVPAEEKDKCSNIRGDESVKRVAETIFKIKGHTAGPFCILQNKLFQTLQEDTNRGLLCVPKPTADEENLDRGDFDVIISHPVHGYIYIEVKAFGDAQDDLQPAEVLRRFLKVLEDKAVKRLKKGRRALQCLQPNGRCINITTTLALPNISRSYLKRALQNDPALREDLSRCIVPNKKRASTVAVEDFCLCSDDLPPKDATVDEADDRVRTAIGQWWKIITQSSTGQKALSSDTFRLVLASFCRSEDARSLSELVHEIGIRNQSLRLDDQQTAILQSNKQYQFITGPPGCGKTVVLAAKSLQLLKENEAVFVVYSHGRLTKQPATEFLINFMEIISGISRVDFDSKFPYFHKKSISDHTDVTEYLENIVEIKNNPDLGKMPKTAKRKPQDKMFDQISGAGNRIEVEFTSSALPDGFVKEEIEKRDTKSGKGITFVIDELTMRTITGQTTELIRKIMKQLPAARIWCAGPFPSHCPKHFNTETLFYSYRCPPKCQRLLSALERFCQNEQSSCVYKYVTSSTAVPDSPTKSSRDEQYRLPAEGTDPIFMSHAGHGSVEVTECRACADRLVNYLKNDLKVCNCDIKDGCGHQLKQSDVLILITGTAQYNHMGSLVYSEFYQQLTKGKEGYRVTIYKIEDDFHLHRPGMPIMHIRAAYGTEKKVVVCVPCRQHQATPMTYAEAVRKQQFSPSAQIGPHSQKVSTGRPLNQGLTVKASGQAADTPNVVDSQVDQKQAITPPLLDKLQALEVNDVHEQTFCGQDEGRAPQDLTAGPNATADNSQIKIRQTLNMCQHITEAEKGTLARLGVLSLHWLWYGVSRSLAHVIIYHF